MMAMNKHRYYVEEKPLKISADQLVKKVRDSFQGAKINSVKLYEDPSRSAEINITIAGKKLEGTGTKTTAPQRQPGYTIFVDPYSGQILDQYSYRDTWFYQVFALHRWLLGSNTGIGKYIVGFSTLIFLFILVTGIILWWPRTKKILQQRLKIKWSAGWKRINHDLHLVFGFYSAIFLFIFAFTGLAWSFEWFNKSIYTVTNSPIKPPPPPKSTYIATAEKISFDQAMVAAKTVYPDAEYYNITMPKDSAGAVNVTALRKNAVHESATDAAYIDQYSGKVLGKMEFGERSLGAQVRSAFKPVHTGSIWGTPSKIIAFIVCLLGVTFPVTGTIMWINRTRKKKKFGAKAAALQEELEYAD